MNISAAANEQVEEAKASNPERPVPGGVATWAGIIGYPPGSTIFPFTPGERIGLRNLGEFQVLMYRPLYWLGRDGQPGIDEDLSLAYLPEWSDDGRTATVTLKPWKWSNGEPICADNVLFWVNMMVVRGDRYGAYARGYFPDNLVSYAKVAPDKVAFTFNNAYSKTWVLMNQFTLITPMPRAWDRTADGPANASGDLADIPAVYDYLLEQNGPWAEEGNELRTKWPASPVWSVVNGPWRLKEYTLDGTVTFVPNEHYCGPVKPKLNEFRQVMIPNDEYLLAALRRGPAGQDSINVGYLPYGLGTELIVDGANPLAEHYRLVPHNLPFLCYMPMNFENETATGEIIRQTYFRQALQLSLDQDTIIRDIFHGYAYRTSGPVPLVPDGEHVSPFVRANPLAFDIDRARELLAGHGWDVSTVPAVCVRPGSGPGCAGEGISAGDVLSVTVRYVDGRDSILRLLRLFQADAAKAGIEVRLQPVNGSVMIAEDHAPDSPKKTLWDMESWNGGWIFCGHVTGEMLFKTGAISNFGHYSDPRADELIERTVVSDDVGALHDYQDYIAMQVPSVWMPAFPFRLLEIARNLSGVEPLNPYGHLTPENWYYVEQ